MSFNLRVLLVSLYGILCSCGHQGKDEHERIFIGNDYNGVKSIKAIEFLKLGDRNINDRKYKTALKYYLKANNVEPYNATILNSIANTESSLGKTDRAFSHFKKAIEIDSSYLQAYASYGTCLGENKKYNEAVKILKQGYLKSSPNQFVHYALSFNLSIYYYKLGNCRAANEYVKIALKNKFKNEMFDNEANKIAKTINENCKP